MLISYSSFTGMLIRLPFWMIFSISRQNTEGSIVNTISPRHIDGYLRALTAIAKHLQKSPDEWKKYLNDFSSGLVSYIATRLRSIYGSDADEDSKNEICNYLYSKIHELANNLNISLTSRNHTQYEKIAGSFLDTYRDNHDVNSRHYTQLKPYLESTLKKSWSCYDLHNSIFIRPDEIRTCCKRFFMDEEIRGDVTLLNKTDVCSGKYTPGDIVERKKDLLMNINAGEDSACAGCPFLEFKDWGNIENFKANHLSLEYHSVCNLKCTYCSDTYYGGAKPQYDIGDLLDRLSSEHYLDQCQSIVWGGGEPVADPKFNNFITLLAERLPGIKQRVLTNSVKYSAVIQSLLNDNKIIVTTSIDAGDEQTFNQVRGKDKMHQVYTNLKRYSEYQPGNVTIKYIFTNENTNIDQVKQYVSWIKHYELTKCNFQISSDFKDDHITAESLACMVAMHGLLIEADCRLCFFDDLVWHRLNNTRPEDGNDN